MRYYPPQDPLNLWTSCTLKEREREGVDLGGQRNVEDLEGTDWGVKQNQNVMHVTFKNEIYENYFKLLILSGCKIWYNFYVFCFQILN